MPREERPPGRGQIVLDEQRRGFGNHAVTEGAPRECRRGDRGDEDCDESFLHGRLFFHGGRKLVD